MSTTTKDEAPRSTTTPPAPTGRVSKPPAQPPVPSAPDPISEALAKALDSAAARSAGAANKSAAGKAVESALEFGRSMRKLRNTDAPPAPDLTKKFEALKPA